MWRNEDVSCPVLRAPAGRVTVAPDVSGVLTQVTAAGGAVGAALEPVHNVLKVSAVAAPLTPHKQALHHMVAHCAHTRTLVAPRGEDAGRRSEVKSCQNGV